MLLALHNIFQGVQHKRFRWCNHYIIYFRESNTRGLDAVDESGCTDTENTAAMDKFATCNHNILTKVDLINLITFEIIKFKLS